MSKGLLIFAVLSIISGVALFFALKGPSDPKLAEMKALYERTDDIPFPLANPYSEAKYELGKMLFFDTRLSDNGAISCATCHNPVYHWTDNHPISMGLGHQMLERRTMSLLNLAWDEDILWDGREDSLESQVEEALTAPGGMNNDISAIINRIHAVEGYRKLFKEAFENERDLYKRNDYVNLDSIKAAISTFERKIISGQAPFDDWIEGDEDAISESAKRGFDIFNNKGKCADCHTGWRFSDGKFYNIGVKEREGIVDIGRGVKGPLKPELQFKFKAVGLRNIAERPPYMHNGSLNTLREVIDLYDKGGEHIIENTEIEVLNLTEQEKVDLEEFLKTLTSQDPLVSLPVLPPNTP